MAKEIERKFLVTDRSFISQAEAAVSIRQAYISTDPDATVRIRIRDKEAFLTVKGRSSGAIRDEWEYPVPVADAEEMARRLCGGFAIDKTRYIVDHLGWKWEVDLFHGHHEGLILAEIEMPSADSNPPLPPWMNTLSPGLTRAFSVNA